MEITLQSVSKRYVSDWVIKDFNHHFISKSITGVTGVNGSGKSTLIKLLSGYLSPSKGTISYTVGEKAIQRSDIYQYVKIAAPYTDLIVEYDLEEMYNFHTSLVHLRGVDDYVTFRDIVRLKGHANKPLAYYSSGMKQRVQLALAVLSESNLLLLDEPTAYLDTENKQWFYELLGQNLSDKTIVISSNDKDDFFYCEKILSL